MTIAPTTLPDLLNRPLYDRLQAAYGSVRVANRGRCARFSPVTRNGRLGLKVHRDGECYRVCCPFCTDRRHRLYVSYLFGARVPTAEGLAEAGILAWCHNETHCLSRKVNREELVDVLVFDDVPMLPYAATATGSEDDEQIIFPSELTRLHDLPKLHQARLYLERRRFTLRQCDEANIQYCGLLPEMPYLSNRLFFPFYDIEGRLLGGQLRLPYDTDQEWPPKYLSLPNFKKSETLYNLQAAAQQTAMAVVTEGPLDALRLGKYGLALAGCDLSDAQLEILLSGRWQTVLFALDADLEDAANTVFGLPGALQKVVEAQAALRRCGIHTGSVALPEKADPAALPLAELWPLVLDAWRAAHKGE